MRASENGSGGMKSNMLLSGGTACDLLMTGEGMDFRAAKDIDLVLIAEAVDSKFASHFWNT